ncbi:MAG: universal stress protein [Candidimonas sp.]|nr:MAG: universal stress protein [Candidimonas sp.]TAM23914.1 MAG: universal stress protein [Candidimonas sp.]
MLGRIALDLTNDANQARRVQTAIQLAVHHKAELIGVCTDLPPPYMYGVAGASGQILAKLLEQIAREKVETKERFLKQAALAGINAQCRMPNGSIEEALAVHARSCDLLIMSQTDAAQPNWAIPASVVDSVITAAGRPVLVTPYIGQIQRPIGQHVLFCWDYGRRSARALADAAPIISAASTLTVLTVDPQPELLRSLDIESGDLSAYCAAHSYPKPREVHTSSEGIGVGNSILNAATDYGCDMIVMGLYNRSRVREWILGGTSKTLLQSMTVPIVFSH